MGCECGSDDGGSDGGDRSAGMAAHRSLDWWRMQLLKGGGNDGGS